MLELIQTKRTDKRILERMRKHYSQPKGFVGRSICYAILYDQVYYGHIVAGSATRFLPGRNEFLGIELKDLNKVINNIFYNISVNPETGKYPTRNFTTKVLKQFVKQSVVDWNNKYGDVCVGFETLVKKPRTGELYLRGGWQVVGETKGYTCKRTGGKGSDSWGGKRVWNTDPDKLQPKLVICKKIISTNVPLANNRKKR